MLLKGPLILMVAGLAVLALVIADRSAAGCWQLKPVIACVWFALLVLPWFVAIFGRAGSEFFTNQSARICSARYSPSQESHGAPPGFYFVLFWITFWPGAMLAGLSAPSVWAARHEPATRFLLSWLVPSWIVFELVITKLPHYVLPLYPAIAILIAGVVDRARCRAALA